MREIQVRGVLRMAEEFAAVAASKQGAALFGSLKLQAAVPFGHRSNSKYQK
jgi:hypothetical protein